jgi:hypothetical protein
MCVSFYDFAHFHPFSHEHAQNEFRSSCPQDLFFPWISLPSVSNEIVSAFLNKERDPKTEC